MSVRYDVEILADGARYEFITSAGDIYIAYFTEFILLDPFEEELSVASFGFNCKRFDEEKRQRHDGWVKLTIIHIIKEFFNEQTENAILYICMNKD